MPTELAQWITPAIVILGFLFTARTIRNQRVEIGSRMDRMESRLARRIDGVKSETRDLRVQMKSQTSDLRDRMESQTSDLRDRMESQTIELRDRMESQTNDLRDRMGRIEGTLDVLREFLVGTGRGSVA